MTIEVTARAKRYLRGLAHPLKPVLQVGQRGVTDALVAELDRTLEQHELVKVKLTTDDREDRKVSIQALVDRTSACRIQVVGKTVTLYRPAADKPGIDLPR